MLAVVMQSAAVVYTVASIVLCAQPAALLEAIPLTEKALRETFDSSGIRK